MSKYLYLWNKQISELTDEESEIKAYLIKQNYNHILGNDEIRKEMDDWIDKEQRHKINPLEENPFLIGIRAFTDYLDMAQQFITIQPLYYNNSGIWWAWNHKLKKWEMIDDTDLMNRIDLALKNTAVKTTSSGIKNEILESLKRKARQNKPIDLDKYVVQFGKEIVNIKTGELTEATSKYFCINPIPHKIGESEDTPILDKIFKEWVGDKYTNTLYQMIAYSIIPDYPIHRFFVLIGSGLNGKSTFLNVIIKFVGIENRCSTELDTLLLSRFEVTKLYKKLICVMGETNFNELKNTSLLKRLSGGDTIGYEFKNKTPFDDVNYAKIIIATNSLPQTHDKTDGFYRRPLIISFNNRFTEKRDILSEIPEIEFNNLAKKSIRILRELLEKKEFDNEGSIEERKQVYEENSNPIKTFIDKECEINPNYEVPFYLFYDAFAKYLTDRGYRQLTKKSVGNSLRDEGLEISTPRNVNNISCRLIIGLKFKEKAVKTTETTETTELHINSLYSEKVEKTVVSVASVVRLNFDERCLINKPCMYPIENDKCCGESPCNEYSDGLVYCKEHFELIQTEEVIN